MHLFLVKLILLISPFTLTQGTFHCKMLSSLATSSNLYSNIRLWLPWFRINSTFIRLLTFIVKWKTLSEKKSLVAHWCQYTAYSLVSNGIKRADMRNRLIFCRLNFTFVTCNGITKYLSKLCWTNTANLSLGLLVRKIYISNSLVGYTKS